MKHQRIILALLLLLVAASPMLVQGAQKALSKPSVPANNQVSDNDTDDGNVGGHHEANETGDHHDNESITGANHEENKTAEHVDDDNDNDDATEVDNTHTVNPSENVKITHCLDNSGVDLTIRIVVVPVEGAQM